MSFSRKFSKFPIEGYQAFFQVVTQSSYRISHKNQQAFSQPTTWFSASSFFKRTDISSCRRQMDFLKEDHQFLLRKVFVFLFQMVAGSFYRVSHRRSLSSRPHFLLLEKYQETSRKSKKKAFYRRQLVFLTEVHQLLLKKIASLP